MKQTKDSFLFGIATSSYHYEGHNYNSDWRRFEEDFFKDNPDQMCGVSIDYWNRWKEDHEYLTELGVGAFRTSVEWSRIQPAPGEFDEEALEQYKEMFRDLKKRNIKVVLTLFHYTSPLWFTQMGGFQDKRNLIYFKQFISRTLEELHPYVDIVTPMNEILVYATLGHLIAYWPPQHRSILHFLRTVRNLIRSHFIVAEEIHQKKYDIEISTAEHTRIFHFIEKAWYIELPAQMLNYMFNRAVTKSIVRNQFVFPFGAEGRVTKRKFRPVDYIGIQFYPSVNISVIRDKFLPRLVPYKFNGTWTQALMTAKLKPKDLFLTIREYSKLGKPILITESGVQTTVDRKRVVKLRANILTVKRAIAKGLDIRGYFYFTLFDCFEWAEGYSKKFGLVAIDRDNNLKRKKKASFEAYKQTIREF
jgi:beta-glucosidase